MSLLQKRLSSKNASPIAPSWVSDKNVTIKVYNLINELKETKLAAIKDMTITELRAKKNYQISAGELSRALGIAKTTLISTSSYSKNLKAYLDSVNNVLAEIRDGRINGYIANQHTVKQRKKDIIVEENKKLKEAYEKLQQENASEQVRMILNSLSLPVRTRLGLK